MYSAYKLNKQGDYTQTWFIPFPVWNQSVDPCPVLIVASWPAYRFLRRQIKKQQLELNMEQQTCSQLQKEYVKAVYCHPAYLAYMQSTSWEMLHWMKHKLESRLPGEIWITSDTTLMTESEEELKSLLMKVKKESEKAGLKLNIQKTKIMASGPITSWQIDGETI